MIKLVFINRIVKILKSRISQNIFAWMYMVKDKCYQSISKGKQSDINEKGLAQMSDKEKYAKVNQQ